MDRNSTSNTGSNTFAWGKDINKSEIGHDKLIKVRGRAKPQTAD